MARGMTKAVCLAFEKLATAEIEKVLGKGKDEYEDGGSTLSWNFPYGETGNVRLHLHCDSKEKGHGHRSSWLHSRISDPRFVGNDGYTKNRDQIEGEWPFAFTYPSGKNNLHPGYKDDIETMRRDLATFLYSIAPYGSPEKHGFGEIKFENANE